MQRKTKTKSQTQPRIHEKIIKCVKGFTSRKKRMSITSTTTSSASTVSTQTNQKRVIIHSAVLAAGGCSSHTHFSVTCVECGCNNYISYIQLGQSSLVSKMSIDVPAHNLTQVTIMCMHVCSVGPFSLTKCLTSYLGAQIIIRFLIKFIS